MSPGGVEINALPSDEANFGDTVILVCENLGGPNNTYLWFKDGQVFYNESESNLTLIAVNSTHGGQYTCMVSNPAGSMNSTITLYIQPYIVAPPESLISVQNGTDVTFDCMVDSFPFPNISWIKFDRDTGPNFTTVSFDEKLVFSPVLFGDEGYYACVASAQRVDGRRLVDAVSIPSSELAGKSTVSINLHIPL